MRLFHHTAPSVGLRRPRWVALGAAVAIVLGAGGVLTSAAAGGSAPAASFVAITPCRLIDTRPAPDNVGAMSTPVGTADTFTTAVTGANGQCSIPASAVAASFNITAIAPTAASFLTVFPADQPKPLAASLNWVAGQAPTPNAVTALLSADGKVSFYNLAGSVQLTVDVVGYYEPAGDAMGQTGPKGDPGDAAPRPLHIVWVAKSGGDFTTVSAALASIDDNSGLNPYLIRVAPGTYVENAGIDLLDYVDIEGSGENVTTLLCGCSSETNPLFGGSSALVRASGASLHSGLRGLTISNAGGAGTYASAVWIGNVGSGHISLDHVTANALSASGHYAYGLAVLYAVATAENLTANASGDGSSLGVFVWGSGSELVVHDSRLRGNTSMLLFAGARSIAYDSVFNGTTSGMSGHCVGAVDISLIAYSCV